MKCSGWPTEQVQRLTSRGKQGVGAQCGVLVVAGQDVRVDLQGDADIGVADGADKPDISTVPALTSALRNARSVAYSQAGQSGIYFRTLIERLGIAVNRQRWLYNFRNRHGFTDGGDTAFDQLWTNGGLTWGELCAISDSALAVRAR